MNKEWSTLKKLIWYKATLGNARLPDGYKRLLGFKFDNNSYYVIDDFRLTGADTLKFSFSATTACNILGCYTSGSAQTNYSLYVGTTTANYLRYNGGTYNSKITSGTKYDMVITPTGATGLGTASTWTQKEFTAESDMCIATTSETASSSKLVGNLYGIIEVVGRLKLIPCERLSDHVFGYYDLESDTFYEPETGTPESLGDY